MPVKAVELLSDEAEAGRTVHATVKRTIAACFEPVAVETIAENPAHAGIRLATVTGMVVSAWLCDRARVEEKKEGAVTYQNQKLASR